MSDSNVDIDDLKESLKSLKELDFSETISSLYQKKFDFLIELFDYGAETFKKSQELIVNGLDTRILNEYQYFSRAQNSFLRASVKGVLDIDICLAIDDALSASRHILNDNLDILTLHASSERKRLNDICEMIHISDVYEDDDKVRASITYFEDKIATTRRTRGILRIEEYIEMVSSDNYSVLMRFFSDIEEIEIKIKKKKKSEYVVGRRWIVGIVLIIAGWVFIPIIKAEINKLYQDTSSQQ